MKPLILLTGATGYIGGRLLKLFEAERHPVRCLVRRPEFFRGRAAPETDVIAGDLLDSESLRKAMNGVHTAYYLVHSMGTSQGFEETDRRAANILPARRALRESGESSISGAWETDLSSFRRICAAARRSGRS